MKTTQTFLADKNRKTTETPKHSPKTGNSPHFDGIRQNHTENALCLLLFSIRIFSASKFGS